MCKLQTGELQNQRMLCSQSVPFSIPVGWMLPALCQLLASSREGYRHTAEPLTQDKYCILQDKRLFTETLAESDSFLKAAATAESDALMQCKGKQRPTAHYHHNFCFCAISKILIIILLPIIETSNI